MKKIQLLLEVLTIENSSKDFINLTDEVAVRLTKIIGSKNGSCHNNNSCANNDHCSNNGVCNNNGGCQNET